MNMNTGLQYAFCGYRATTEGSAMALYGGKDRAGIGALIEEIWGIRQEIIEITFDQCTGGRYPPASTMVKRRREDRQPPADESLKYLFGADEEYILSFYREAEKKYGSMEDFLRGRLGVTDEDRAAMQEMYLV